MAKRQVSYRPELVEKDIVLSVRHLKQFFKFGHGRNSFKTKAVHDVSFDIKKGECFGLVGESGCGKTTTGRSLIRLYQITSGSIYFKGYRISAGKRWNEKEIKFKRIKTRNALKKLDVDETKELFVLNDFSGIGVKVEEAQDRLNQIKVELKKANELYKNNLYAINLVENEDEKQNLLKLATDRHTKLETGLLAEQKELKEKKAQLEVELQKALLDRKSAHVEVDPEQLAKINEINARYEAKRKELKENLKKTIKEQKAAIKQINFDNSHVDRKLMAKMQMIFQDPVDSLDPRMTVEDIIQEGLRIQGYHNGYENSKKVKEVLEKVGLLAEYSSRYPHEFSGGQRQRIGIARALIMNPEFLICDEPISALDVSIRAQIINLLNDLKNELGLTLLFIAHDLSVVKYFCDRIAVMYYGQIVELASSDELFKHPLHPYTRALLSAIPKPDPLSEKKRVRFVYNPREEHDYTNERPKLVEILPGHLVLANTPEIEVYKTKIKELDKALKVNESKKVAGQVAPKKAPVKKTKKA